MSPATDRTEPKVFEGHVVEEYDYDAGDSPIAPNFYRIGHEDINSILEKFEGKKIRITIEEVADE